MSILPTTTQSSTSSSSSSSSVSNQYSKHGSHHHQNLFNSHSQSPPPSPSRQIPSFGSLDHNDSGTIAPAAEHSGESSKKVNEFITVNGKKDSPHEGLDIHTECQPQGSRVGSALSKGRMSGPKQHARSSNSQESYSHSGGRRSQTFSGNHLLNFHYDPISRSQARAPPPPPRRHYKRKPYNKDLFLQANFKFVVLDTGNYMLESMDPDKTLQWEDIICMRYSTPSSVQCPICLDSPLCPQITSCGHIFCFPCILQYLLMGEEDHKGDCGKRCPLCFLMISMKDLYTLYIENVKQYHVGDKVEFLLLTRKKDSFTLSHRNKPETDVISGSSVECSDPFSKFILTSDVDLSVRKAITDLDGWLVRADSGLVDDLENLPYVCAAMEQLEQRKNYWHERQASNGTNSDNSDGGICTDKSVDAADRLESEAILSSSCEASQINNGQSNSLRPVNDNESYNFYQAFDGQHIILHPLNMKCLLHHFESHDMLPYRISGRILQLETVTQSEAMRRRYRYLSHFSLTATFQLCEIDLSELLPHDALLPFMDEINKREKQRKETARKERKAKAKAEVSMACSVPIFSNYGQSLHDESPTFSMDDFQALGTSTPTSSSPPVVGERKLFSNVTRLGFAAAHDSPSLKVEERNCLHKNEVTKDSSGVAGTTSFANIISRTKSVENVDASKVNELGKKGKKPSRVLLSTSGGRRY